MTRSSIFPAALLLLTLVIPGCSAGAQSTSAAATAIARGSWGGAGAEATLTDEGATFRFQCAEGRIAAPLHLNEDGSFEANGLFTRSGGRQLDAPAAQKSVTYRGRIEEKTLLLVVDFDDSESDREYTLYRDRDAQLKNCS